MTLAAAERHPVQAIDIVELEPAVVRASELFMPFTGDVLADPRVDLIVADGRNHLALSDRQYDVIISEPSNVWISGMANLFTQEFFRLARNRLRPGGLMVQWVHAYSMASADFKMMVRTFQSVFPNLTVWEVDLHNDYLLVGSIDAVTVDAETLQNLLVDEGMRHDLATMSITDLASFAGKLLMVGDDISRYAAGAPVHTDANGLLEYTAPRALLQNSPRLLEELYQHRSSPRDVIRALGWDAGDSLLETQLDRRYASRREAMEGYVSISEGAQRQAIESFGRALALSPEDYDTGTLLAGLHLELGKRLEQEQRPAEAAEAFSASVRTLDRLVAVDGYLGSAQWDVEVLRAQAYLHLGVIRLESNSLDRAAQALRESLSGEVKYAKAYNNLGVIHERLGRYREAMTQYLRALEIDPNHVSARMNLGNVHLAQLRYGEAVESYLLVQELRPDSELVHYNLGVAYFRQGELAKASKEWTRALQLKPDFPEARKSLDVVQKRMKQP
jgi:spermidine synthase